MLIKNNKTKGHYFHYKVEGKNFKYFIPALATVEIIDLINIFQIVSNTYDRRIRHIEDKFGYNFDTVFEIPGDPDFPSFSIVSSTSAFGTISPLGITKIAKGENLKYTMTPNEDANFIITAHTTNPIYGTISPSGNSISSYVFHYLDTFLIDGINFVSAVTGNISSSTIYEFFNISAPHTVVPNFATSASTPSQLFTMTASAATITLTALTQGNSGGTISPSGTSIDSGSYNYLSSFLIDSIENINNVSGETSATSTYNLSISGNHDINPIFSSIKGNKTFTMSAISGYHLNKLLINSIDRIADVSGNVTGISTYNMAEITTEAIIESLFKINNFKISFNNISNSPVTPASSVTGWNTYFDATNPAISDKSFDNIEIDNNSVIFYGPASLKLKTELFYGNTDIISAIDSPFVTEIGADAFDSCSSLTGVSFPSVVTLKEYAFFLCSSLSNTFFPKTTTIEANTFYGCENLTNISLPMATTFGNQVFKNCTSLKSISLPMATTFGNEIFNSCTSLKNISLPVTTIFGTSMFHSCTSLTGVSFPLITAFTNSQFYGCTSLINVSSPILVEIKDFAFYGCTSLPEMPSLSSTTIIGENSFNSCTSLKNVASQSVITIGGASFQGCASLVTALFPMVTASTTSQFTNCISLSAVSFPLITRVEDNMFYNCASLTNIFFPLVETIGQNAFLGCTNLSTMTIPKTTTIGNSAFFNCSSLNNVSLQNVTSIDIQAFNGCTSLTNISFPSATVIGNFAFGDCTALTNISLSSVTTMGTNVFYNISGNIITLTIPQILLASGNSSIMSLTGNNTVTIIAT
jgi:hypothetical protein